MDDPLPNRILAIDTSLTHLSVALTTADTLLAAVSLEGRESRNQKLLPAVNWILEETGTSLQKIELFVVTRGPGSFTGVRIGLATVQGLAMALGRPVCALSTHEAGLAAAGDARSVLVYGDAGRGESYASGFEGGAETMPPTLLTRDQLELRGNQFQALVDVGAVALNQNLALLAARRAMWITAEGRIDGYRDLSPIYVRLAEAEVKLTQRSSDG